MMTAVSSRRHTPARELALYLAASFAAFAVDVGLLAALVKLAGWHYLAAAAASFIAGGVFLYVLCVKYVFRFRRIQDPTLELPYFVGLGLVGLAVNTAAMYAAVELAHVYFLLAKVGAAGCTCLVNFALRRALLFAPAARAGTAADKT